MLLEIVNYLRSRYFLELFERLSSEFFWNSNLIEDIFKKNAFFLVDNLKKYFEDHRIFTFYLVTHSKGAQKIFLSNAFISLLMFRVHRKKDLGSGATTF